jgi:nucleotide-binding universal stress UspA family protein
MARVRKILCAVDFSEPSREALHYAADLAARFGADLVLLHVYQLPGYAFPEGIVLAGPEVLADLLGRIDASLQSWRTEAVARGANRVEITTAQGAPWSEIVRTAGEGGYDLVVVGTHGRTGLGHALLGSVAERVVRKAPCPVLTVRADHHRLEERRQG